MSTPNRYWGGSSVKGGKVRDLEVPSFADLVARHFNVPVSLPYTREEWTAMQRAVRGAEAALEIEKSPENKAAFRKAKDTYNDAKDVAYVCSCNFTETFRNDENAGQLVLVCFDIDDSDIARPFVESPQTILDALYPLNVVAYHTASSTPEFPRIRVIVEVDPCELSWHKRMVAHVARLLGLPRRWSGYTESAKVSQPMYRPVKLKDEEFTSMLVSRHDSVPLQTTDIPEEVIEETDRTYAYSSNWDEETELCDLPVTGVTVEDIREPLFKIDPDCGYLEWTQICCALLHTYRSEEDAEAAFHLFLEWSETGSKFKGFDDVYSKWKSFRPDYKGRRPVTLRTLFHVASTQYGWVNSKIAGKLGVSIAGKIEACNDLDVLRVEGPAWIANMPLTNEIVAEDLMRDLQNRIKVLNKGRSPDLKAIRHEVSRSKRVLKAEESGNKVPNWLRPWCYVRPLDQFYNTISGELLKPEAFNRTFGLQMMPATPAEDGLKNNRPAVMPADYALNTADAKGESLIPKVSGILYDPKHYGSDSYFKKNGNTYVNSYRPSTVPAEDPANAARAMEILLDHLRQIIPDEKDVQTTLCWMAFIVQNVGVKIRWQPLIQGAQGCGKTMILNALGAAIGETNVKLVNPGAIKGDYNDWAYEAQCVGIEEIWVQGPGRAAVMNSIKDVATNDRIALNVKFRNVTTVDNHVNLIAFSNHRNALFLEESDRRWFVIMSTIQSEAQAAALADRMHGKRRHFERFALLFTKLAGALRSALLAHKIPKSFDPNGRAPVTPYRQMMIEASKNPLQKKIEGLLRDDLALTAPDIVFLPDLESRLPSELTRHNHPVDHYLSTLGFMPHAPGTEFQVNGCKGPIWTHRERHDECLGDPHTILLERLAEKPDELI